MVFQVNKDITPVNIFGRQLCFGSTVGQDEQVIRNDFRRLEAELN